MLAASSSSLVIRVDVPSALDLELAWFIDERLRTETTPWRIDPDDPDQRWEQTALTAIGGWLRALDPYDADILRCAYTPSDPGWRSLGRLTGVFARFASAEPGWPDAIDWRSAMRHVCTAAEVFRAALRAYARERGPGPCMRHRVT